MKFFLVIFVSFWSGSIFAQNTQDEFCNTANSVAEIVMKQRQNGVAMADIYATTSDVKPQLAKDFIRAVIKDAYKKPRFNSPEYKQKAITDFKNEIFLSCLSQKRT